MTEQAREAADEIERLQKCCEAYRLEVNGLRSAVKQMREDFRRIQMLAEQHCQDDASEVVKLDREIAAFAADQEPLPADMAAVWEENTDKLYESS